MDDCQIFRDLEKANCHKTNPAPPAVCNIAKAMNLKMYQFKKNLDPRVSMDDKVGIANIVAGFQQSAVGVGGVPYPTTDVTWQDALYCRTRDGTYFSKADITQMGYSPTNVISSSLNYDYILPTPVYSDYIINPYLLLLLVVILVCVYCIYRRFKAHKAHAATAAHAEQTVQNV